MSIEQWWPKLKPSTRDWLVENNGDVVPAEVLREIEDAGGSAGSGAWWVGGRARRLLFLGRGHRLD